MNRCIAVLLAVSLSVCIQFTVIDTATATPTTYQSGYFNSSLNITASESIQTYSTGYFNSSLNVRTAATEASGYFNSSLNVMGLDTRCTGYFNSSLNITEGHGGSTSDYCWFTYSVDNLTVTVNDSSDLSDVTSYYYSFGDGSNVTTANATHTYESGGTYEILHKVTNTSGISKYNVQEVTVSEPEVPHEPPLSLEFNWINTIVLPMFGILLVFGLVFVISRYSG